MNKIQIRYFQTVLIIGLIVSEIISSLPLMYASLFGLVSIWFYESIISQSISVSVNKNLIIFFGLLAYFFAILFYQNSEKISTYFDLGDPAFRGIFGSSQRR